MNKLLLFPFLGNVFPSDNSILDDTGPLVEINTSKRRYSWSYQSSKSGIGEPIIVLHIIDLITFSMVSSESPFTDSITNAFDLVHSSAQQQLSQQQCK